MGVVLREYQRTAQQQIIDAWGNGARGAMFTLATGLGKTATITNLIAKHCKGRGIVQAHRSELVGQLSLALAKEGVEHDITASANVRRQIIDNHLDKLGRSFYRPDSDWSVESVDTALRRDPKKGIDYVFIDESHHCFPAGTLVDGVPIAQLKVGQLVTAFDEASGRFERKAITHLFKHIAPKNMVRIRCNGVVIDSTSTHPFWTQRGWVAASLLTTDDSLLFASDCAWHPVHDLEVVPSLDGYVYNIEVADFHTYTANNIVVHNCLAANKWGRALLRYENAKWCMPTATAGRADGMGLGRHADGLADVLLEGPNLAWGMANGFLVEYDILTPTASDLDLGGLAVGASGEYNQKEVAKRVKQSSKIVGDAVQHYKDYAMGRLCIVFAVDIDHAQTLLAEYLKSGIPAELVTGEDLDSARLGALKRFESRQTLVLINVDLFGEGTDVPGVEVVQMCRPTASFPLFVQQVGRMLRLDIDPMLMRLWDTLTVEERRFQIAASRKPKALLIDHVGNIHREFKICDVTYSGPPEGFNAWSLDRRGRRAGKPGAAIPMRMCNGCYQPYERFYDSCPFCGELAPEPMERGAPEQVDGALQFYDPALLAKMRADVARIDGAPVLPSGLAGYAEVGARKNWQERQAAQHLLRNTIAAWAGKHHNVADSVNYKRFFLTFGVDVVGAATLGVTEANALREKIEKELMP